MKIRNGFISNSSSSSFIVRNEQISHNKKAVEIAMRKIIDERNAEIDAYVAWKKWKKKKKRKQTEKEFLASTKYFSGEFSHYYVNANRQPYTIFEVLVSGEDNILEEKWNGVKLSPGQVVIESSDDNSIPNDMFDEIEAIFKATRKHMG